VELSLEKRPIWMGKNVGRAVDKLYLRSTTEKWVSEWVGMFREWLARVYNQNMVKDLE